MSCCDPLKLISLQVIYGLSVEQDFFRSEDKNKKLRKMRNNTNTLTLIILGPIERSQPPDWEPLFWDLFCQCCDVSLHLVVVQWSHKQFFNWITMKFIYYIVDRKRKVFFCVPATQNTKVSHWNRKQDVVLWIKRIKNQ